MKAKKDYKSEVLDIIKTKDWDRTRWSKDRNLYQYIRQYKDTDKNCKTIWEHIRPRKYESEVLEIIETKNWDRAYRPNDINLYSYVRCHRNTDENCKTIWEHINQLNKDHESEISEIIETKDWDRAKGSNDRDLYGYIHRHKDIDESCKIVWDHIKAERERYSIKDYLLYYFKHGKLTEISNKSLYTWFKNRVKRGNQSCIDIKNLIVAAENFQDPIALETLELIKNHLEKEGI